MLDLRHDVDSNTYLITKQEDLCQLHPMLETCVPGAWTAMVLVPVFSNATLCAGRSNNLAFQLDRASLFCGMEGLMS